MYKHPKTLSILFRLVLGLAALVALAPHGDSSAYAQAIPGIIAYVRPSTHDIHLISPDGTGDRVLWTAPQPLSQMAPLDLAWRPDGGELAFSSDHEETCSWYQSDVYAIGYNGTGYRRVTNSPSCAALAGLPKGSVTVNVSNYTSSLVWVYVQGAPEVKSILGSGTVTFDDVADFGPGVLQPSIGIWGLYRFTSYPPYADVQPGQTVPGGNIVIMQYSGFDGFGAGKVSWKADGSALAYGMRSASGISQIPANPSYGSTGVDLPVVEHAMPSLVAWGPTAATINQYLYLSGSDPLYEDIEGIYLNTVGNTSGGTKLVPIDFYNAETVLDIEWLPDGSGFLFSERWVPLDICSDIFEYNFATQEITKLTPSLLDEYGDGGARGLSISPDGQQIVFERAIYPFDTASSLWIMNRDGSNMHKLADDASSPAWGQIPSLPAPTITGLNPFSAIVGGSAFTLTVNGTNFASGSIVRWNGSDRTTMYVNNTQLTASIQAVDITTAGSASVTVFNPPPGGGTSNTVTFPINDTTPLTPILYLPFVKR